MRWVSANRKAPGSTLPEVLPGSPTPARQREALGKGHPPHWTACEYPERPANSDVRYHVGRYCAGCRIAARAFAMQFLGNGLRQQVAETVEFLQDHPVGRKSKTISPNKAILIHSYYYPNEGEQL